MKTTIQYAGHEFECDLSEPLDISIPVSRGGSPNAFFLHQPSFITVESGGFIGDVKRGGSCNVEDIYLSPHGNGTHTECAGHISNEKISILESLREYFFLARLITLEPVNREAQSVLDSGSIKKIMDKNDLEVRALIIRTLPNLPSKRSHNYSGSNPPFCTSGFIEHVNSLGVHHLLVDLPSLDREDDSELKAHHTFFGNTLSLSIEKTVTELIYVPEEYQDGLYWLNLVPAPIESDASPSKPILYRTRMKE